jgi:alpha-ribazole phosphatase
MTDKAALLYAWRHPRPLSGTAICTGRTDVAVDRRRAKRLAHRIRTFARRHRLPHIVLTSPLARCRASGRWLARWGWQHRVDAALLEIDFGRWDGRPWAELPRAEIEAWRDDLAHHAPGGGENLVALLVRVRGFDPGDARILVSHGGWMAAARWAGEHATGAPDVRSWPRTPRYGERFALTLAGPGARVSPA